MSKLPRYQLVLIGIALIITLLTVGGLFRAKNAAPNPTGSSTAQSSSNEPDVTEGAANSDVTKAAGDLTARFVALPWTKLLPHFTDHYSISFSGTIDKPSVDIILESKNATEFTQYQSEALAWLKAQGAPVDTLQKQVSFRPQKAL